LKGVSEGQARASNQPTDIKAGGKSEKCASVL
jgi:hypothetical protein